MSDVFVFTGRGSGRACAVLIVFAATYAGSASALEFGALSVQSHLNEPLDATVRVTHLSASEIADLDVGIAPPKMFKRFGIRRSSAVDQIRIDTRYDKRLHRAFVHLSTQRPIREPFVDFLLEADTGNGSALREYTAMLNPAGAASATPASTAKMQQSPSRSRVGREQASSSAPHRRRSIDKDNAHTVRAGETLWSIAAANKPSGANVAQTASAIYRANPDAFGSNMSILRQGARLTIPDASTIRDVDTAQAKQRLARTQPAHSGEAAADTSDSKGDRVAASGQAPPDRLKTNSDDSKISKPSAAPASNADEKIVTGHDAGAATATPFGRLSLPSDTPWPAPATASVNQTVADSATNGDGTKAGAVTSAKTSSPADSESGPNPDQRSKPKGDASDSSNRHGPDSTANSAADSGVATAAADKSPASFKTATPPVDVAESDNGSLASPRNLLLLAVLVILVLFGARRWRESRYKTVELEPVSDETAADAAPAAAAVDATPREADARAASSPQVPDAAITSLIPVTVPAAPIMLRRRTDKPDAENRPAADSARDEQVGAMSRSPTSDTAIDVATDDDISHDRALDDPAVPVTYADADDLDAQTDSIAEQTPDLPRAGQEIEALAFETQPLPERNERRHDLGGNEQSGLSFDADAWRPEPEHDAEEPVEQPDSGAGESNPYGLEMIDPGEFDLYGPSSDTAGQSDDDPKQSVAIRLDLARMYIEMDDASAARELLADVQERGDDEQRRAAEQLVERLEP